MATFGTFVAGQVLTAAELNTAGAWNTYTPTWTQSATITKTTNWARYTQLGKWVHGSIKMTASSAGTANNKILVGLPVSASANNFIVGTMIFIDDSATTQQMVPVSAFYDTSTTMSFTANASQATVTNTQFAIGVTDETKRFGEDFTGANSVSITGKTIASGDVIYIQFMYEAA